MKESKICVVVVAVVSVSRRTDATGRVERNEEEDHRRRERMKNEEECLDHII